MKPVAHVERRIAFQRRDTDRPGGDYGRFDTLFGMSRADLAPAGLYNAIIRSNLVSPGVRVEAAPDKRTELMPSLRRSGWRLARTRSPLLECATRPADLARS